MAREWDKWFKHAEEHFKNHEAKLVVNTEDITVIDWRNADGSRPQTACRMAQRVERSEATSEIGDKGAKYVYTVR